MTPPLSERPGRASRRSSAQARLGLGFRLEVQTPDWTECDVASQEHAHQGTEPWPKVRAKRFPSRTESVFLQPESVFGHSTPRENDFRSWREPADSLSRACCLLIRLDFPTFPLSPHPSISLLVGQTACSAARLAACCLCRPLPSTSTSMCRPLSVSSSVSQSAPPTLHLASLAVPTSHPRSPARHTQQGPIPSRGPLTPTPTHMLYTNPHHPFLSRPASHPAASSCVSHVQRHTVWGGPHTSSVHLPWEVFLHGYRCTMRCVSLISFSPWC